MKPVFACGAAYLVMTVSGWTQDNPPPDAGPPPLPPVQGVDQPPPLPATPAVAWFVAQNGQQSGPFDADMLKQMVADGRLTRQTLVWKKGMEGWAAAETLVELQQLFAAAPPTPPFDCAAHLAGTWERIAYVNGQQVNYRFTYDAGGQFSGLISALGLPGANYYGTWKAAAVGAKTCSYTFTTQYPTGGASTSIFDIVDANTMTDKADGGQVSRTQ